MFYQLRLELLHLIGALQDNLLTILLISIAAISNAVMDILKDRFKDSVFSKFNEQFWNPAKSYLNKYIEGDKDKGRKYPSFISGFTDTFSDSWHIFKFILILCIVLIASNSFIEFILYFSLWGIIFKVFYTKLLIK